MSSSSSDSEDENLDLLREAVDTSFISDGMFAKGKSSTEDLKDITSPPKCELIKPNKTSVTTLKSQRYIEHDESESDLNVPKSMQDFVYKKMSKKINDSIEFVEVSTKKSKKRKSAQDEIGCVRLLSDTDPITAIDFQPEINDKPVEGKKLEVKRRIVEPDVYNDEEKVKMVSIDGESILQQTETKSWKPKKVKPNKLFKYREKNAVLYAIEPKNEFTALRKKNNWCESKIAKFPWKNHAKKL
ncbi:uncharacterized protein LOC129578336 [Sitodiplosis mosellana]|uniref:uncharacterized protein LOC129578336 n=1 Tax=Sitodiplosis mosellana TaxID=263140 RepID=UPI0024444CD1|nr:uncharacterized protein LOC129578336 [Sitodiplosis mosellana]